MSSMLFLDMLVLSTISLFGTIASCFIPSVMDPLKSMIHEQFEKLWMLVDGIYHQLSRIVKPVSDPLVDVEALYSLWQEAKHKDVERFYGVSRRSLTSSQKAIPFAFVEDEIEAFYTCLVLHNMAVAEWVSSEDFINEADVIYNVFHPTDNDADAQVLPCENMALRFVKLQEDDVNKRALEIEYLSALGIHVVESTLPFTLRAVIYEIGFL